MLAATLWCRPSRPYIINVAERFERRCKIDENINGVRDRIYSSVHETQQNQFNLRRPWACTVTEPHHCQPLDVEWTNDTQLQRGCAQIVFVSCKVGVYFLPVFYSQVGQVITRADPTEGERVSAFVKGYWEKLRIDINATFTASWSKDRALMLNYNHA